MIKRFFTNMLFVDEWLPWNMREKFYDIFTLQCGQKILHHSTYICATGYSIIYYNATLIVHKIFVNEIKVENAIHANIVNILMHKWIHFFINPLHDSLII